MADSLDLPPVNAAAPSPTPAAPPAASHPPSGSDGRIFDTTSELELLLSGAVLFALFQLPPLLDGAVERAVPHLLRGAATAVLIGQTYVKAGLYALIASFLIHLVARAYWVGLVGLNAAFPKGVNWDEVRHGRLTKEVYRQRLPPLASSIARTDRFCSAIFAFGFLVVLMFVFSMVFLGLSGVVAYGISKLFFGGEHVMGITYTLFGVVFGVGAVAALADKMLGDRVRPGSAPARAIQRAVHASYSMQALMLPLMLTLFSNIPKKVIYPVFYLIFITVLLVVMGELFLSVGALRLDSYTYMPAELDEAGVMDYRFYEDQRPPGEIVSPACLPSSQM